MNYITELQTDNPVITLTNEKDAYDFFEALSDQDKWVDISLDTISIKAEVDDEEHVSLSFTSLPAFKKTTLSPHALYSLKGRALNNAEILHQMSYVDQATMLNMSWPYLKNTLGRVLLRGGKIMAVHSGRYIPISQNSIFCSFMNYMKDEFKTGGFLSTSYRHEKTQITYHAANINDPLMAPFKEAALKFGGLSLSSIASDKVLVKLITGDLGQTATKVYPVLQEGSREFFIGSPLALPHRDSTTLDDIKEAYPQILATLQDGIDNLKRLLEVRIKHPVNCALNVAIKFGLPKKAVNDIRHYFDAMDDNVTAYEIYFTLAEILHEPRFKEYSAERQLDVHEAFSRIILIKNWEKYDTAKSPLY